MEYVKVIGIFDDPIVVGRAESLLIWSGLATRATMRVDSEELVQEPHPPHVPGLAERLKERLPVHAHDEYDRGNDNRSPDGNGRPKALFLTVTVPEEQALLVREIMWREAVARRQQRPA